MRKICVATGTRAEYGLFYPLLKEIKKSRSFTLQIIATGTHLSPEFGLTYREIEKDGFKIHEKVEMLLSADSETAIAKSTGLAVMGIAEALERLRPDMLILLGDRFETLASATAATIMRIPIAHIHGGESTEGAIDEAFRHSVTKMSHIHFTSAEEYRKRVIQLGEDPIRVFNTGALGIDNIKSVRQISRKDFERKIGMKLRERNLLVTYHPETLEGDVSGKHFREVLNALDGFRDAGVIFTMPNADAHGRTLIGMIEDYVRENALRATAFTSMGRELYISAMRHSDAVVGNSSSGIIEAPSLGVPTVNIGLRQRGRVRAQSVIDCQPKAGAVKAAISKALSAEFRKFAGRVRNPYGDGHATGKMLKVLKAIGNAQQLLIKRFYNIK